MNTKKLQSCLNCLSVIKFVKGLQITVMDNPSECFLSWAWPSESVLVLAKPRGKAPLPVPDWDAMMK